MNMQLPDETITNNTQETMDLAKKIANKIDEYKPKVLCLEGNLGTGKTIFVKGFCDFYGIGEQIVKSPTYTYYRLYSSENHEIYHFDYYRLTELDEIVEHELLEIIDKENAIILIEWPEKVKNILPKGTVIINFSYLKEQNKRKIEFATL